jgi:4-amino-4-deoxy-L-arabinose transferase-like glycosyltransferase
MRRLAEAEWGIPLLLVIVSVLPSVALWNRATYLSGDSYQYLRAALTVSRGEGLRDMSGQPFVFLGPLYALVVGLVHSSVRFISIETAARLVSLLGASVAVAAFYVLLRRRHDRMLAVLASLMFALLPLRIWSGQWVLTNGLAMGLTMCGIALLFRSPRPRAAAVVAAGILLGLSYLTRSDGLIFCAGSASYLLVSGVRPTFRARLFVSAMFLAGVALVAFPYHSWVHSQTGAWSTHAATYNLDVANDLYHGTPAPLAGWHFDPASATFIPRAPDVSAAPLVKRYLHFARLELSRLIYLAGPRLLVLPLILVGLLRFVIALGQRRIDAWWQALLLSLLFVLPLFHTEDRYLLPVLPVLCLWTVDGAMSVSNWLGENWSRMWPSLRPLWITCSLLVAILGSYAYRLTTQLQPANNINLPRYVAAWMQANRLPDGRIMAQDPALAFYRGADHVWLPNGEATDLVRYGRQQEVRYIFLSSGDQIPAAQTLMPEAQVNELLPLGSFATPADTARLFQLTNAATASR